MYLYFYGSFKHYTQYTNQGWGPRGLSSSSRTARGPKIVALALASNSSGLGVGLGLDASASSHRSVINVLNCSTFMQCGED